MLGAGVEIRSASVVKAGGNVSLFQQKYRQSSEPFAAVNYAKLADTFRVMREHCVKVREFCRLVSEIYSEGFQPVVRNIPTVFKVHWFSPADEPLKFSRLVLCLALASCLSCRNPYEIKSRSYNAAYQRENIFQYCRHGRLPPLSCLSCSSI